MTNLTFLSKISIMKLNVAWTDIGNKSDSKNAQAAKTNAEPNSSANIDFFIFAPPKIGWFWNYYYCNFIITILYAFETFA